MTEGAPQHWVKQTENEDGDGLSKDELSELTELAELTESRVTLGPLGEEPPPSE